MPDIAFRGFGKIPRLFRDIVITEKIDGSNAAIGIVFTSLEEMPDLDDVVKQVDRGGFEVNGLHNVALVYAQSRKRLITPEKDNYGFARWVYDNAETLVTDLGEGLHFGEWWGSGIQRGYGLEKGDKRFSLFNVKRWHGEPFHTPGVSTVPILFEGLLDTEVIRDVMGDLQQQGSSANPGFKAPEGIVIYHKQGNLLFKATLVGDEIPKTQLDHRKLI